MALGLVMLASHLAMLNSNIRPEWVWLAICGGPAIPAAILIFTMACNVGLVSRVLSARALELLGEISYSIYLLHAAISYCFLLWIPPMGNLMTSLSYVAAVILLSYVVWAVVECPVRRAIHGRNPFPRAIPQSA
jgi:peptidoglycan/LPS O-acetylase OafA/YrhL